MNQEQPLDLLSQLQIPQWMMQNIKNLQDPQIFIETESNLNEISQVQNLFQSKNDHRKEKSHVSYELHTYKNHNNSESSSQEESDEKKSLDKTSLITKKESKNKQQRRNQTSRKYRQRKKQYTKNLENQNNFLRFKVDELTFRLHEVSTELNKFKNNCQQQQNMPNYHQIKSQCLQEVENVLNNNVEDHAKFLEIEKKLNSLIAFDGKQKIDLLNYFMSELMENVITDKAFYMIDCLINQKGVHRPNESVKLSKMDEEIFEILKLYDSKKQFRIKQLSWQQVAIQCKKFQEYWKKLYQVYLAILNQGFKIERILEKYKNKLKDIISVKNMLSLQVYFQKNKYRSDIREMRSFWFRELERQNSVRQIKSRQSDQNMKVAYKN